MARTVICLLLVLFTTGNIYSQNLRKSQELYLEAEYFLMFEDYSDALPIYLSIYKEFPENYNLSYKIGLCYLNLPGQKEKAIEYLEQAAQNSSADYREGSLKQQSAPYVALYELANAYRINFQFDKAKTMFRQYSETLLPSDTEDILFIEHQIKVCDNAKELLKKPIEFTEENLGDIINDSYANLNPVISPSGESMIFMTSLKFYDAIFFTNRARGKWSGPINITPDLQSDGNHYVSCLADNGNTLYFSKVIDDESDIYLSRYNGEKWAAATKLDKSINSKYWEAHASVTPDGTTMIFASDRPGGFGGLDLYISTLNSDGTWGVPLNLGPEINTSFNEDRPFISENGKTLHFCSQGHYNMGGFDLFKSDKLENGHWKNPENLGYPLNTPDDDTFFMPANSGKNGYISVYRQGKGNGKEDIYYISFK